MKRDQTNESVHEFTVQMSFLCCVIAKSLWRDLNTQQQCAQENCHGHTLHSLLCDRQNNALMSVGMMTFKLTIGKTVI